jgi:HK97 gp10 family phage protein
MKTELKLTGIDGIIATLRALPPEIVSKRGGPAKAALRKAARVIQKPAVANVRASADEDREATELLAKSVVVTRGKPPSDGKGERYLVRVKRKTYPGRSGKPTTTLKTAQLKEYGSSQQQAEPWLRPAFAAKAKEAIGVVTTELVKGIDRVVAKLAKQNGGR